MWLISYEYPGTKNGRDVGLVYATGPYFGADVWSHTYDPDEAAAWATEAAALRERNRHYWPNSDAVPRSDARMLHVPGYQAVTD